MQSSLKLHFLVNMSVEVTMSSHKNNLRSLIRQLVDVKATIEKEDAKAILLKCLPFQYDNVIFTLSEMFSHTLEDTISSFLAEEKRATA